MDYNFNEIEKKWQDHWEEKEIYKVENQSKKPKYYVLDMFPYPSGSGLHVGHPLGYIASDIYSRYKRLKGYNVLHPMGFDAFGLPAEQYAIQTGQHPAKTTHDNIKTYKGQLRQLGFCYDWDREVQTCDPKYYKWTQWIFLQLFKSWFNNETNKAEYIADTLIPKFEAGGSAAANGASGEEHNFTAEEWKAKSEKEQQEILMDFRLAYQSYTTVNWCAELGTVLANDEVKDGFSERGGHPVVRKEMRQWFMRTTAFVQRLLDDLEELDWSEAMKEMQRNWFGRSEGASMWFDIEGTDQKFEIFTTRPDTIFGVTFMVLAPEHELVQQITTPEQQAGIDEYLDYVNRRSDIERQAEKAVTGAFTGAYAVHPFSGEKVPIYISEYVLIGYGTGAIMAVPADDERDQRFAEKFDIPIVKIIDKSDYPGAGIEDKVGKMINSGFINGMEVKEAIQAIIERLEEKGIGTRHINFRMRDAGYSRQRYWGEPFPIVYRDGVPYALEESELPVTLPQVESYTPTGTGESPLASVEEWVNTSQGRRETDTMPGYAGSSWYFLRYMDANNEEAFVSKEIEEYWQNVDLYIGGTEHAVGHLIYSRTWHKFMYDLGLVSTKEPFKRLVNQGMIQGRSNFVYRANEGFAEQFFKRELQKYEMDFQTDYPIAGDYVDFAFPEHKLALEIKSGQDLKRYVSELQPRFDEEGWKVLGVSTQEIGKYYNNFDIIIKRIHKAFEGEVDNSHLDDIEAHPLFFSLDFVEKHNMDKLVTALHVDVNIVKSDHLDIEKFMQWRAEYSNAVFVTNEDGEYLCGHAVEKMSKSKYNVVNPDDMVAQYGADCFRMFEMFLGPIEQSKPWNTDGIEGVSKFLRKFWRLFKVDESGKINVSDEKANPKELKVLHNTIKKINQDIERLSFNTCVSAFMECTNDLGKMKSHKRAVLQPLVILIAPFAPYIAEELWHKLGNEGTVHSAAYPIHEEKFIKEDTHTYPIQIGKKVRARMAFPLDISKEEVEATVMANETVREWVDGKTVRKFVYVKGRIINIVV